MKKIVVLASGRGSNFKAILDSIKSGDLKLDVLALISDIPTAGALDIAREDGIPAIAIDRKSYSKPHYNTLLMAKLMELDPDLIVLAGYMRILPKGVVDYFLDKIVNIHPSILPSFPGLHAQRQALEYGVKFSGCTVHLVDNGLDSGAILGQAVVPVLPDDTEDTLSKRILVEEHKLYTEVLKTLE